MIRIFDLILDFSKETHPKFSKLEMFFFFDAVYSSHTNKKVGPVVSTGHETRKGQKAPVSRF